MLIKEEPVIALPTAHYVVFYPCPSALSLLLFPFTSNCLLPVATHHYTKYAIVYAVISYPLHLSRPLTLFALCVSVARAFLSCYNYHPGLNSNSSEKEDCSADPDNAKTNGLESLIEANVNSDKLSTHFESGTEINYSRFQNHWRGPILDRFCTRPHQKKSAEGALHILPTVSYIEP